MPSPIPGYIGNLNCKIFDVIQLGSVVASVVANVIDNSNLWVRLDVPGELADRMVPGLQVILRGRSQAVFGCWGGSFYSAIPG